MNKVFLGLFILLLFNSLGELVNNYITDTLPGSVFGMLLLLIALQTKIIKEEYLEVVVGFIMKNMSIFFLPAAVGIIAVASVVREHIWAILSTGIVSTFAVIGSVGAAQQWLMRRNKRK